MKKNLKIKQILLKDIPVYEHLEFDLAHTTYTDRLRWLADANAFVRMVEEARRKKKLFLGKH